MEERKILELEHNKEILDSNEDVIWGWSGPAGRLRLERRAKIINDFIREHIESTKKDNVKILELGCGIGLFTEVLANTFDCRIISLDIYDAFIRKAVDRVKGTDRKRLFLVADAESPPFLNEAFDIVMGVSVLHHLSLEAVLKEISRVLKIGGRFIFSEPNMLNPQIFLQKNIKVIKKYAGDSPSETAFFPFALKAEFSKYNLKADIVPFDFLHPKTPEIFIPVVSRLGSWMEKSNFFKYISGSLLIQGEKV